MVKYVTLFLDSGIINHQVVIVTSAAPRGLKYNLLAGAACLFTHIVSVKNKNLSKSLTKHLIQYEMKT